MIRVLTNDGQNGYWVIVIKDGRIIHQGHSLNVYDFASLVGVEVESFDDDTIIDFQNRFSPNDPTKRITIEGSIF